MFRRVSVKSTDSAASRKMGLFAAVCMAVGTMIGASIFSIFGVGAQIALQDLPEAFLLSGLYALVVAYSYARLGRVYISNAGPVAFIVHAFGDTLLTGTLSILMWFTYVISIALFANGFAGYFLPLLHIRTTAISLDAAEAGVIFLFMGMNFFGSATFGKMETIIVLIKLAILAVFIVAGVSTIKEMNIAPRLDAHHVHGLLDASVIFFLSYMGFGLITNASENIRDARKNVPRGIYISIGVVMIIYILVALVAVGNLSIAELIRAKENALAIAARPFLGTLGFLLISIGAVFSISSALNATLYGGANIAYSLAKDGDLPQFFERKVWFKSTEGLYITAGLSLLISLVFDINGIASITSIVFTVLYIFVLCSHIRLRATVGGPLWLLLFNLSVLVVVFLLLLIYQYKTDITAMIGVAVIFAGASLLELGYRVLRQRSITVRAVGQGRPRPGADSREA